MYTRLSALALIIQSNGLGVNALIRTIIYGRVYG